MLIVFLIAEAIVLTNIMAPLFRNTLGQSMRESTNFPLASVFYIIYVAGIYWFVVRTGVKSDSLGLVVFSGAFLGLIAFGTFDITNFLILKKWTYQLVIFDVLWGMIITSTLSIVGFYVSKLFSASNLS
jgi:uncharacterized membrane protein